MNISSIRTASGKSYGLGKLAKGDYQYEDIEVYVIYPDKQPVLPKWLESYEKMRMNVTRIDSMCDCLKGYFSIYKKVFQKGEVTLYGCSPDNMLNEEWYVESKGANYCMYSVALKPIR